MLGDYNDFYQYNAYLLDGHTVHWSPTTIPVYGLIGAGWGKAIKRWPTVYFQAISTKSAWGIYIPGDDDRDNGHGLASFTYHNAGALEWCAVKVDFFHGDMNCTRVIDSIAHEMDHCIGVFKYTTDRGPMDGKADGSNEITFPVSAIVGLLYNFAPGIDIRDQLLARRPGRIATMSRYQTHGR